MCRANESPILFEIDESTINARMTDAAKWVATTSAAEMMAWREAAITDFENRATLMRDMGLCDAWFSGANCDVAQVSRAVNGPLAEWLACKSECKDAESVQLFRTGARASGKLPCSGVTPFSPRAFSLTKFVTSCFSYHFRYWRAIRISTWLAPGGT